MFARNLDEVDLSNEDHLKNPYPKGFEKVDIPEGVSGPWAVQKFEATREGVGLFNLRLIRDGEGHRIVPPGRYTRLVYRHDPKNKHKDDVVMSDTPAEAHEHLKAYLMAKGNMLVNGLGLGFFLKAILAKNDPIKHTWAVKSVTVVEKSRDVIKLVGPSFKNDPRVKIVRADAFKYEPVPPKGGKFDYVWHDIWTNASSEQADEHATLRRKYGRICKAQGCWGSEYL